MIPRRELRIMVLALARHTGWPWSDIAAMPVSRFLWWIEGVREWQKTNG
ncbi:hypothetical protein [Roseovarius ramblicola]